MKGKRFIHTLKLQNFFSFGNEGEEIELQPLNVIIGTNSSGKSNLIESIGVLKATPTDLLTPIRQGGGISELLWKGDNSVPIAQIEAIVEYPKNMLRYRITFTAVDQKLEVVDEAIENQNSYSGQGNLDFYYQYQNGNPVFTIQDLPEGKRRKTSIRRRWELSQNQSILSQVKDPEQYPEITYLANQFSNIGLYREWNIGRSSVARLPQQTDLVEHPLLEYGSNLGIFWNNLQHQLGTRKVSEKLNKFYEVAEELTTKI